MLSMHVHVYACPHPLDICLHYQNLELPWRPKTAKEYTKTAKEIVLGGQPPSNMRQEQRAKETRFSWQPVVKKSHSWLYVPAAKLIVFLGRFEAGYKHGN